MQGRGTHRGRRSVRYGSYSCLVTNYWGVMALPTEPPYCLVYPMVYDDNAADKTHFNTVGCPSGMHTEACVCHSLLHLMDTNPTNRQKLIIAEWHNHCGPLMDLNTGEPYPMEVAGNFCLEDTFFPGCPRDSLVFHNSELTELVRQGYHIPTYWEKAAGPTSSTKMHQSPKPPQREEEHSKPSGKTSGTSSPQIPDSTSTSKPSHKSKHSPTAKEQRDKHDHEKCSPQAKEQKDKRNHKDCNTSTRPKEQSHGEKDNKCSSDKDSSGSASQRNHKHGPSLCPLSLE